MKERSKSIRDMLNNCIGFVGDDNDVESVVIRCALESAIEILEEYMYNDFIKPEGNPIQSSEITEILETYPKSISTEQYPSGSILKALSESFSLKSQSSGIIEILRKISTADRLSVIEDCRHGRKVTAIKWLSRIYNIKLDQARDVVNIITL